MAFDIKKISDADHVCQLKFFIKKKNVCEWRDLETKEKYTVRWNLDDLISYLQSTLIFLHKDEPFPIAVNGECAEEMDNNARDFESEDDAEMEDYYGRLNDWSYLHSWNHAGAGAVLPDVMFRKVEENVEISWWTDQEDEGRIFTNKYGYYLIPMKEYTNLIEELVNQYNLLWL